MTPSEILMKHEDANEYHFHEVDRKWIIEAMEEYASVSKMEIVQLPSDEEMDKFLLDNSYEYGYGFKDAINWMREQILKNK